MDVFEQLRAGWRLASAVRKQIFNDKALLFYMVLSTIIIIVEAAAIFGTFILVNIPALSASASSSSTSNPYISLEFILLLLLFYVVSSFTSAYVLMALFIAFKSYTAGNRISLREALGRTSGYSRLILEWALFYSVIILLIRLLESRFRGIGASIVGLIAGVALSIGVMFALPVIYEQRVGPIKAMKISASTFVNHFGSSVGGIVYSDLYGLAIALIGIAALIALSFLGAALGSIMFVAIGFLAFLIFIIIGATISSTTSNVFKLLLYDYASGKDLPTWLDENLVKTAIRYKRSQAPPPPPTNAVNY